MFVTGPFANVVKYFVREAVGIIVVGTGARILEKKPIASYRAFQ